jgi:hypothetical protein
MKRTRYIVAIDNGTSGAIAVLDLKNGTSAFVETPIYTCPSYTKEPKKITRINWRELLENIPPKDTFVVLERPLVNPRMFSATQSALRSLEATLIVLEMLDLEYEYCDSKSWQKEFLSSALIGKEEMKKGSMEVAIKLFPQHRTKIEKHKDGDPLLMALYIKKKYDFEEIFVD